MRRRFAYALLTLFAALVVVAFVCALASVWATEGTRLRSGLGGTAAICSIAACIAFIAGVTTLPDDPEPGDHERAGADT